ncbi:MAG TPA: DNA-binding response regulator, partial [Verrucomicrobiales bacterium]|nr:DNA-binding response regulator [Verrucomicrobiales bacterium]
MKTLLVVEDQVVMRQKTVTILRMEGYEVLEASGGEEGIRIALEELPDLILCDIMMPDRDGYAVLQAVRLNRATATTPFIFLTARGEKTDVRNGMNLGADDYLVKPVTRATLLEAVEARLERQRLNEDRLRQELARTSFQPDFSSPAPLTERLGLTPRAAEALLWVAQGKSNGDIASILGITEKTVKKLLGQVFDRLGVESRTAAALAALDALPRAPI